jgi:hypothetical protein
MTMGETETDEYRARLVARLGDVWAARFDTLRGLLTFGPGYDRGVADSWRTAVRMATYGNRDDEAAYWLAEAMRVAGIAAR